MDSRGKKTAFAVHEEISREVDQWLSVIFTGRRKAGHWDLESVETLTRSTMHQAGATAMSELLQFAAPSAEKRSVPCSCGHSAHYQEVRSKEVLTAVGSTVVSRPYYLCAHCHIGQFPADVELDIENLELSPGVRRMLAVVGQATPFEQGRQQMKLLAGLEVTTKAVERSAEAIGEDIAAREREQIQQAVQLNLPVVVGQPVAILYIQMDGTGVPVTKAERREGKVEGQPAHTREVKLGCVFTQTTWDQEGYRDPRSGFDDVCRPPSRLPASFGPRLYLRSLGSRVGVVPQTKVATRRRSGMDLESRRRSLSRRHSDRRPVSRAPTPLGRGAQADPSRP